MLTVGGATATSVLSWSDSEISAIVPDDALTGVVKARVQDNDSDEKPLVVLWDNENPENVVVPGNHMSPLFSQLLADGEGGAIVVWNDYRNYDPASSAPHQINIYAQRLNSRGKMLWTSEGVPLSTAAGGQYFPQLVSDGSGGAIVVWEDYRSGSDSNGVPRWSANGVAISTAPNNPQFLFPEIVPDGSGGAIIVWQDYRSGTWYEYAQRVDGAGATHWTEDGAAISTAVLHQMYPEITSDLSGGAIIVWEDSRTGSAVDLYAQGISFGGRQ